MVEVVVTAEFRKWYEALSARDQEPIIHAVKLLQDAGVALPFPHSSAIAGSKIAMRELRIKSRGKQIRVFYVFDAERQAVLLIAGNKVGNKRFYEEMVPRAERLWDEYLTEVNKPTGRTS
jgi:hypothetical protein